MKVYAALIITFVFFILAGCSQPESEVETVEQPVGLETSRDKASYALGYDIGSNLLQGQLDIEIDILAMGMRDAFEENEPQLSLEEQQVALNILQQEMMQRQMEVSQHQAEENIEKGRKFMEEYREKVDVEQTESGMLYRMLVEGEGSKPGPEDVVTVHYTGELIDGTVFDSSVERGQPATFPLNQVIPGWTEILQMMPEGSRWEVVIPQELAYGRQQAGPDIGPGSTLLFEIELLEIGGD